VNVHNPRFVKTSRQTIARDLIKLYNECMDKLMETLKSRCHLLLLHLISGQERLKKIT
jgi:hypothetical protein